MDNTPERQIALPHACRPGPWVSGFGFTSPDLGVRFCHHGFVSRRGVASTMVAMRKLRLDLRLNDRARD